MWGQVPFDFSTGGCIPSDIERFERGQSASGFVNTDSLPRDFVKTYMWKNEHVPGLPRAC